MRGEEPAGTVRCQPCRSRRHQVHRGSVVEIGCVIFAARVQRMGPVCVGCPTSGGVAELLRAVKDGVSVSKVIRKALRQYVKAS